MSEFEIKITDKLKHLNNLKTFGVIGKTKNDNEILGWSKGGEVQMRHLSNQHILRETQLVPQDLLFWKADRIRELSNVVYRAFYDIEHKYNWAKFEGKENTHRCLLILVFLRCLAAKLEGKEIIERIKAYEIFGLKLGIKIFSDKNIAMQCLTDVVILSGNEKEEAWKKDST